MSDSPQDEFSRQAEDQSPGLLREIIGYLRENKKWWMIPILVVLLLAGALILLSGTAAAPFIYTLF